MERQRGPVNVTSSLIDLKRIQRIYDQSSQDAVGDPLSLKTRYLLTLAHDPSSEPIITLSLGSCIARNLHVPVEIVSPDFGEALALPMEAIAAIFAKSVGRSEPMRGDPTNLTAWEKLSMLNELMEAIMMRDAGKMTRMTTYIVERFGLPVSLQGNTHHILRVVHPNFLISEGLINAATLKLNNMSLGHPMGPLKTDS